VKAKRCQGSAAGACDEHERDQGAVAALDFAHKVALLVRGNLAVAADPPGFKPTDNDARRCEP
jgi:hypothetical protein